jgi:phosphatidylserine/phosphatidylglycerophosphate/cardiolipin synthase-like enzyme
LDYLGDRGFAIQFADLIEHTRELGTIARNLRMDSEGIIVYPPLRALFHAIQRAQSFIHFTSFGLSYVILGALKLAAQSIPVRGIVSVASTQLANELAEFRDEAPHLEVRVFNVPTQSEDGVAVPHHNLIVIDGLLAFKGSANLTINSWRRAAEGRDIIETVTDVGQLVRLHNRFFSPIWADFSDTRIIRMLDSEPSSY